MSDVPLAELSRVAVLAARAGGAVLAGWPRAGLAVERKGAPGDLVTAADRAAEAEVRAVLARERPDDGFLGEEGGAHAGSSGLTWIVDPLDGTTNFVRGIVYWSTSVAVRRDRDGAMLAGAVDAPELSRTYHAGAGLGAWLERGDGAPVRLRRDDSAAAERALLSWGFSYDARLREHQARALVDVIGSVADVRRLGAASLDLCAVAEGVLDACLESDLAVHDYAAGALIAAEAGARVSGADAAAPPSRELVLAARSDLHDLLLPRSGVR